MTSNHRIIARGWRMLVVLALIIGVVPLDVAVAQSATALPTVESNGVSASRSSATAPAVLDRVEAVRQARDRSVLSAPNAPDAVSITATKHAALAVDNNSNGLADPGDTLEYTVIVTNGGSTDAASTQFTDTIDANTTLVGGSLSTSPVAVNDTYPQTVIGNVSIDSALIPFSVLTNDYLGQNPTATITAYDATSANGGTVVVNVDGTFTYDPPPGFEGTDTFSYTLSNSTGSSVGVVSLTVSGMVWFVNNNVASCTSVANGCGRLSHPFSTLAAFNTANGAADVPPSHIFNPAANDNIFIYESAAAYTSAVTLLSGQKLIGQDATASLASITGLTPPSGSASFPAMNSANGTVTNIASTVTLNTNVTVRGLQINSTTNTGMNDPASAISGVSVSEVSIATTTGTAVVLSSAGGTFSFASVSANGAANGISLSGTTGSFTVTGDGTNVNNGSGGTIQNTTSDGVSLSNAQNVTLNQMRIQSIASANGVKGTQVTNFSFTNGAISNIGTSGTYHESAIAFMNGTLGTGDNIDGTLTVTGNTFTNLHYGGVEIESDAGTVTNANISNNTISSPGFSGINFVGIGSASTAFSLMNATIDQNNISGSGGNGIQINIGNSNAGSTAVATAGIPNDASHRISITNNSIYSIATTGTQAIAIANSGATSAHRTQTNFLIQCNGKNTGGCSAPTANPIGSSSIGTVILIGNNGYSDMTGVIDNNAIVSTQTPNGGGGNGIGGGNGRTVANTDTPNLTLLVTNNSISGTDGNGILLVGRGVTGVANFKIANNNVGAPVNVGGTARQGIRVDAGNSTSADDAVCLNITGNISAGSNGATGIGVRKQGTVATTNDFGLQNIPQNPPSNTDVTNYINAQNPSGGNATIISGSNFVYCSVSSINLVSGSNQKPVTKSAETAKLAVVPELASTPSAAASLPASAEPVASTSSVASTAKPETNQAGNAPVVNAPTSGETINVTIGTLPAGKSITLKFRATVNDPIPAGVLQVSNQGTVSGSNFTSVLTDDPDTVASPDPTVTPLNVQVDLQVTKTVNPAAAYPGLSITYTITYQNVGPQASANVVITDPLPSALTNVAYQSSGSTITQTGSSAWLVGTLLAGQGGMITVTGMISSGLSVPTTITNTATITGTGRDTNTSDNTASVGLPITDQPISGLNATNSSPTQLGSATHLTATVSAGTSVSYQWNFGDGATGSGATSAHTYAAIGTYTATVTATNSTNSQVATTSVIVVDVPISGLNATNDSPTRLGSATNFNATIGAGSNATYAWNFGDGATGSGTTPAHTYAALGTYTATVTATNSVNQQVATTVVTVIDQPIAGLTAANDSPTQVGNTTHFTATISGGSNVTYEWNFGDGTPGSGANTSYTYTSVGSYLATVTATNGVSVVVASTNVSIVDVPITGLSAANSSPTGLGNATIFTATISAGTNVVYAWDFGDGSTGSGAVAAHIYGVLGTYTATVTVTNSVSVMTAMTVATVVNQPISGLSAANSGPTRLASVTIFTATIATGSTVSYAWDFGDGSTGNGINPLHTYAAIGTYTATVTATNILNSQTASTVVVVIDRAIVGLSANNDSPTRLGDTTAFTATIGDGSNVSYQWNFGDGSIGSGATTNHVYSAVGLYTAVVTATNGVSVVLATTSVAIIDMPIVGLAAANSSPTGLGNLTTFTATINAGTNVSYAWDFGDGVTGSGATTSHIYPALGLYTATVTATNSVGNVVATTLVSIVDQPLSNLTAISNSPTLLGNTTLFTATVNGTSVSYAWDFGDGATGSGANPTHTYTATGLYTAIVTATNSTGALTATTKVNIVRGKIYLPLIMRNYVSAPDLIVTNLQVSTGNARVVIKNQGDQPATDGFYVDVYINPHPAPTAVNQIWSDGRSAQGLTWGVTSPLQPGQVLTLTIGDAFYLPDYSVFTGTLPIGTPVYAQVDSFDPATTYGAVLENHEIVGGPYNNILGPVSSTAVFAPLGVPLPIVKGDYWLPVRLKVQ